MKTIYKLVVIAMIALAGVLMTGCRTVQPPGLPGLPPPPPIPVP